MMTMKNVIALILAALMALSIVAIAEDTQNPAMNLIGHYMDETSQRASITIEIGEDQQADVSVFWPNNASEVVEWHFTGACDPDDLSIAYTNGTKNFIAFDENGGIISNVEQYADGTGKLLVDAATGKLTWQDDVEDAGKDCVFAFIAEVVPTVLDGIYMNSPEEDVRIILGEPVREEETENGKVLVYDGIQVAGLDMEAKLLFRDGYLKAMDFVNTDCGDQGRNDLSLLVMDEFAADIADVTEEQIEQYAKTYTDIENVDMLTYAAYYAHDGALMIYLRSAQDGAELLCLDAAIQ